MMQFADLPPGPKIIAGDLIGSPEVFGRNNKVADVTIHTPVDHWVGPVPIALGVYIYVLYTCI